MNVIRAKMALESCLATSKNIPDAGELWIDTKTNTIKIDEGKTSVFELPWVGGVDLNTEPPRKYKMPDHVKRFIEAHIDTIERCDYDKLYSYIVTDEMKRNVTRALLKAGLNPEPYLTTVPRCIRDLLLDLNTYDNVDNLDNKIYIHDYADYEKADVDSRIELYRNKLQKHVALSTVF